MNWNISLPDSARIWIFSLDHAPTCPQHLKEAIDLFLTRWLSHGRRVAGAQTILDERFLVTAGHIPTGGEISGCGMDALFRAVNEACAAAGVRVLPPLLVHYRDETGDIQSISRRTFRTLVENGSAGPSTRILDPSLTTLGALRAGGFERPLHLSWNAAVLRWSEQKV